jgi:hypothetical protein
MTAFERAREIIKDYENRDLKDILFYAKEDFEAIFPELAESEDEKIRKALIRFHKSTIDVDGIKGEDIIAWLEKQGEPINDNIITRDDEILQAISIGLTDALENFGWSDFGGLPIEEIQEWLEKQGEQKTQVHFPKFTFDDVLALQCCMETVKKVQEDKELYEQLNLMHSKVYDAYLLEKQEGCEHIKKEWTTSDADTLKELIDFLENGTAKLQHDLTRYAKWLKIQFTPIEKKSEQKSTWSEEDEEMFKSIMATCELAEQERDSSPARHLLEMQLNWLKSLKQKIKEK